MNETVIELQIVSMLVSCVAMATRWPFFAYLTFLPPTRNSLTLVDRFPYLVKVGRSRGEIKEGKRGRREGG